MTIELIESKLRIMNPDAFHRLCDHFLFFDGDDEFEKDAQWERKRNFLRHDY
jgi:putative hemolysin